MKIRNFKLFTVAAAAAAALAVAPNVLACEQCLPNDNQGGQICWSGFSSGSGSCWLEQDPATCLNSCVLYDSCSDPTADDNIPWNDWYNWDDPFRWS